MTDSPEEIRARIEATRAELGGDVDDVRSSAKAGGNPLAVGLIAFGAGLLAASLIPASTKEKELASGLKEQAQPLVETVKDAAKEVGQNLKEPAQDAAATVKDAASGAIDTVKSEASSAAGEVKDQAQQSKDSVQSS
jgi:gas vesicle protein